MSCLYYCAVILKPEEYHMSIDIMNTIEEGIDLCRYYHTTRYREPVKSHILEMDNPLPSNDNFTYAAKRLDIPAYQLEIIFNHLLTPEGSDLLEQITDTIIIGKMQCSDAISDTYNRFTSMKSSHRLDYQKDMISYNEYLNSVKKPLEEQLGKIILQLVEEAKRFQKGLPFTKDMFGIVATIYRYTHDKTVKTVVYRPDNYDYMLENINWEKADDLVNLSEQDMQQFLAIAKGHSCDRNSQTRELILLPDVIYL